MRAAGLSRRIVALSAGARPSGAEVGFKAARLAAMMRSGLPVPEAFALTVGAYDAFCAANGIVPAAEPAADVAERIRAGVFPPLLLDELRERLAALPGPTFAVRSSALAEDGAACSMAGQLETFLDVRPHDVPEKVKACWAAQFKSAVRAYATKHGLATGSRMGVIVQRQIHPRYAGVLFTLDPITASADQFVVEWVAGLGEALVAGAATPQRIRVSRRRPVVPDGLEPDLATALTQLVKHAAVVERDAGCPVDIEWCVDGTQVLLLQARPITAALARDAVVWTSTNMSENFPRPLTPFAWSIVDEFYTRYVQSLTGMLGIRDPALARRHSPIHRLTGVQGGRVYYNIRSWYELLRTYVPGGGGALRRGLDHYIGQQVPVPLGDGDGNARTERRATGVRRWLAFWPRLAWRLSRGRRSLGRFERVFLGYRRALRQPAYDTLTAPTLMRKLDDLFERFMARHWHHQCIADFSVLVFPGILDALVERWVPCARGAADASARLLRQTATRGTEAVALIARMAVGLSAEPALLALLASGRHTELQDALPAPLRDLYDEFMERFGCRCYHECMIVSPTFEERPDLFWELVEKYRRTGRQLGSRGGASERAGADPADGVLSALPWGKRLITRLALGGARQAIALREQGRVVQSLLFGEVRKLALALGEQLVELGHLGVADDVFYLHTTELRDLCAGKFLLPETLPGLIALRRAALERCEAREPPECFALREGVYVRDQTRPGAAEVDAGGAAGATLRGVGASGGRARGRARVILDPVRDKLEPGEILVARSTDPGWTALFAIAGALVLERGGILSHGAIVAREFGVPAVVGVEGATRLLRGGAQVTVDGDEGEVVILDPAEEKNRHAEGPRPWAGDDRERARDHKIA